MTLSSCPTTDLQSCGWTRSTVTVPVGEARIPRVGVEDEMLVDYVGYPGHWVSAGHGPTDRPRIRQALIGRYEPGEDYFAGSLHGDARVHARGACRATEDDVLLWRASIRAGYTVRTCFTPTRTVRAGEGHVEWPGCLTFGPAAPPVLTITPAGTTLVST